jgi:hypothetical protein
VDAHLRKNSFRKVSLSFPQPFLENGCANIRKGGASGSVVYQINSLGDRKNVMTPQFVHVRYPQSSEQACKINFSFLDAPSNFKNMIISIISPSRSIPIIFGTLQQPEVSTDPSHDLSSQALPDDVILLISRIANINSLQMCVSVAPDGRRNFFDF